MYGKATQVFTTVFLPNGALILRKASAHARFFPTYKSLKRLGVIIEIMAITKPFEIV